MKNVLINRPLLFIFALFLIVSCSKSNDITPASLTGKWKQNGISGKIAITDNGKTTSQDISEQADGSIIEFSADGNAIYEGVALKYSLSGSILTFKESTGSISFDYTVVKKGTNDLTLSFTKDQFYKFLNLFGDPSDATVIGLNKSKDKITTFEYNVNYVKQ
jgi:hypothetical protein